MSAETADRAFEPFFTTKPNARGTGLGLATVYGIVKQAGGNVFLYTEPGQGTSLKIHLPASDRPAAAHVDSAETILKGHGERVIVLEDEPAVRTMVKRILAASNYEVVQFANGRDALRFCADLNERVDLLLTDIVMPGMPGGNVAASARESRPNLKVLFMSGYSEAIIERQEQHSAIEDLLEKPFTAAELLAAVHEAIARPAAGLAGPQ
jgi:CheY-like chemotaxis protein